MVKGISKRVIVVKAPVSSIFDEAIFILREDSPSSHMNTEKILKEACAAADAYVRRNCTEKKFFKWKKRTTIILASIILLSLIVLVFIFL